MEDTIKKDNFKLACSKMHEVPLVLSAFTHLWNPIGFLALWVVEGQYMQRTMHILEGLGHHQKQSNIYPHPYDHPYFGQYFLAGMLQVVGYPESFNLSSSTTNGDMINSIKMLYLVPRVFMGVLAVFDTFLIYKIAEHRYNNRTIALIASVLFAVMPITWLLRKVLLESLLLPLLLSSILFALYTKDQQINHDIKNNKYIPIVIVSGISLGLAILKDSDIHNDSISWIFYRPHKIKSKEKKKGNNLA